MYHFSGNSPSVPFCTKKYKKNPNASTAPFKLKATRPVNAESLKIKFSSFPRLGFVLILSPSPAVLIFSINCPPFSANTLTSSYYNVV
jgi:hypothetical protein